jgi:hypothetical protein
MTLIAQIIRRYAEAIADTSKAINEAAPLLKELWNNGAKVGQIVNNFFSNLIDKISTWIFSIVATIVLPSIPIILDWLKYGEVKRDTFLITSMILSGTFLVISEHNLYRSLYILFLVVSIGFDISSLSKAAEDMAAVYAGTLFIAIIVAHATERFWWHVVLDRPFPDGAPHD